MNEVILLLGGNQGDRFGYLFRAIQRLQTVLTPVHSSSFYLTEPWGVPDQPWFINVCLNMRSSLKPLELLAQLQEIELELGRVREVKWGPRSLDIDILAYGQEVISLPNLQIPHPELPHRRFALIPMAEITPDWNHPRLNKNPQGLLSHCQSTEKVIRL